MDKEPGFWTKLMEALAPKENRLVAAVAFFRTFGQTIRGSALIGSLLGAGVTVTEIATVDWVVLGFAAASILLTAIVSGADAYFNVLANGVSKKYAEAIQTTLVAKAAEEENDSKVTAGGVTMKKEDIPGGQ
jgi:hypothetical protein